MQLHHSSQHCLQLGLMVVAVAVAAAVVVDFCQIGTLNMRQSRLLCWLQALWSVRWLQEGKVLAKHRKRKVNNIILEAYTKRTERLPGSSCAAHTHTHTHTVHGLQQSQKGMVLLLLLLLLLGWWTAK